jgi:atypical dual specificity phosphatase
MPAPGVMFSIDHDLTLVRAAGVTHLVTLTEFPLPAEALRRHGLVALFFPISDLGIPSPPQVKDLCVRVAGLLQQGSVVAYHCKAGLGRTGTMLAAQLIFEGMSSAAALALVRTAEANFVQSSQQEQFLARFEQWLRAH